MPLPLPPVAAQAAIGGARYDYERAVGTTVALSIPVVDLAEDTDWSTYVNWPAEEVQHEPPHGSVSG